MFNVSDWKRRGCAVAAPLFEGFRVLLFVLVLRLVFFNEMSRLVFESKGCLSLLVAASFFISIFSR